MMEASRVFFCERSVSKMKGPNRAQFTQSNCPFALVDEWPPLCTFKYTLDRVGHVLQAPVVQTVDNFTQWIHCYPIEQFSFNLHIWPDFCNITHFIIETLSLLF